MGSGSTKRVIWRSTPTFTQVRFYTTTKNKCLEERERGQIERQKRRMKRVSTILPAVSFHERARQTFLRLISSAVTDYALHHLPYKLFKSKEHEHNRSDSAANWFSFEEVFRSLVGLCACGVCLVISSIHTPHTGRMRGRERSWTEEKVGRKPFYSRINFYELFQLWYSCTLDDIIMWVCVCASATCAPCATTKCGKPIRAYLDIIVNHKMSM